MHASRPCILALLTHVQIEPASEIFGLRCSRTEVLTKEVDDRCLASARVALQPVGAFWEAQHGCGWWPQP